MHSTQNFLNTRIKDTELCIRTINCLCKTDVNNIYDLIQLNEADLLRIKGFGRKCLKELKSFLKSNGLKLGLSKKYIEETLNCIAPSQLEPIDQPEETLEPDGLVISIADNINVLRPLSDFNVSVRAKNCLNDRAVLIGDLTQLNEIELLKIRSMGRGTLQEIKKLLTFLQLELGTKISDWDPLTISKSQLLYQSRIAALQKNEVHIAMRSAYQRSPENLEEELYAISKKMPFQNERSRQIWIRFMGWDGTGRKTLQAIGTEFNITRERVRQIIKKFTNNLKPQQEVTPFLDKCLEYVETHKINSKSNIEKNLQKTGITQKHFDVSALRRTAHLFQKKIDWEIFKIADHPYVMNENESTWARFILSKASRAMSRYGYGIAEELVSNSACPISAAKAIEIISLVPEVRWLDLDKNFFYFPSARNKLISAIKRILSVCVELDVNEVKEALRRNKRIIRIPSRETLKSLCQYVDGLTVEAEKIIAQPAIPPSEILSDNYLKLISVFEKHGSVLPYELLRRESLNLGMNSITFDIYLSSGSIIKNLGTQLYALRGVSIDETLLSHWQSEREHQKQKKLFDSGYMPDGKLWIKASIDTHLLRTGYLSLPKELIKILRNTYEVFDTEKENFGFLTSHANQVWGMKKALIAKGADLEDILLLIFDQISGSLMFAIGDASYIEDIRQGKEQFILPEDEAIDTISDSDVSSLIKSDDNSLDDDLYS